MFEKKTSIAFTILFIVCFVGQLRAFNPDQAEQLKRTLQCESCDLFRANLTAAKLKGANLAGANLIAAKLNVADLRDANLNGANLSGADLSGADLRGARLEGAYLGSSQVGGKLWPKALLSEARWIDGRICAQISHGACE